MNARKRKNAAPQPMIVTLTFERPRDLIEFMRLNSLARGKYGKSVQEGGGWLLPAPPGEIPGFLEALQTYGGRIEP